jgi:hypothetical protein
VLEDFGAGAQQAVVAGGGGLGYQGQHAAFEGRVAAHQHRPAELPELGAGVKQRVQLLMGDAPALAVGEGLDVFL